MHSDYYIGLMSGTSADAIDAVIVDFCAPIQLAAFHSQPIPPALREEIHQLTIPGNDEINRAGALDQQLGDLFAECVRTLLHKSNLSFADIRAIGSHGQTVRHRPATDNKRGYTLQVGDPNIIAHATGITTVADFRRRDIAAGGQGAPLVPAFHRAVFAAAEIDRIIINIGGIANLTYLPTDGEIMGFDTGPGNTLMDAWIGQHHGFAYDANGDWAASGKVHPRLLDALLDHPFFTEHPPKSTGREVFNLTWLLRVIAQINEPIEPADVQATLLELTVQSLAWCIDALQSGSATELFVCGGGAYNRKLMEQLAKKLPYYTVDTTQKLSVAPEWVEAMAFAWLARQTMNQACGNLCSVTGAKKEAILGGVYFA